MGAGAIAKDVKHAMGAMAKPSGHGETTPREHVMAPIATNATDIHKGILCRAASRFIMMNHYAS